MICDTYFFLLENPGQRQIALCEDLIRHQSDAFRQNVYENARGMRFASKEQAYLDWMSVGRSMGLAFADGKDTLLKIILKARDEPEFIQKWIEHHANIVGYHNLIIMDCGSTDERYLEMLRSYEDRVLIFEYRRFYNDLHSTNSNPGFFKLVSRNCRYVTILDADEFLVGLEDGRLSGSSVRKILSEGTEKVYAGTWLTNVPLTSGESGDIEWEDSVRLRLSTRDLVNGTVAGKTVALATEVFAMKHLGHNMHVAEVMRLAGEGSYGKLFVLHLKLHEDVIRKRILKHLVSAGLVDATVKDLDAHFSQLMLSDQSLTPRLKGYMKRYLSPHGAEDSVPGQLHDTMLLTGRVDWEAASDLADLVEAVDFVALQAQRESMCRSS